METPKGTALITGASSGIGLEIAKVFAQKGHDLVLVARSRQALEHVAEQLGAECGVRVTVIDADLFQPDAAQQVYDAVRARGLVIDYLVNDAGQGVYGKFTETELEQEIDIVNLNVVSLVILTKLFLRDMVSRGQGRVLQLASIVSKAPSPLMAVYGATKAFVYSFSEAVANELKGTGVTMTALRPGATDTDFFRKAGAESMRTVTEGKLAPADEVARAGYEAMMRGEDAVVAGLVNKVQDLAGELMPDKAVAARMRKMNEPSKTRSGRAKAGETVE